MLNKQTVQIQRGNTLTYNFTLRVTGEEFQTFSLKLFYMRNAIESSSRRLTRAVEIRVQGLPPLRV